MSIRLMTATAMFDKPSFFVARYSSYYLLLDSDIIGNIVDLIHKEDSGIYSSVVKYIWHKQRTSYSDDSGVTDQGHLTEKLMNKSQNFCSTTLEQNVEEKVNQSTKL